ncbi:MAG TPA: MFS transporter [Gaiellales bacterium]|nr:MFS transporter [Gaiellales bacterium]
MRLRIPATLRLVEFRRFWIGQSVSMLGDQVTIIALPLTAVLVLDVTPAEMGYLTAAELLPNLIFSLHAGAWVDRRGSQRQTMIAADIGRGLLLGSVPIAYAFDVLTIQQLYVVGFFSGVCSVLFFVAYNTVFTNLVEREHYVEANSLTNGSRAATFVVGPSIAGLLVQAVSGPFTLAIDAVSFLVSAVFLGTIHPRQPEPEEHQRGSVMVGARFIAGDLMLRTMLLSVATINLFNFAFWAIYFLYVTHELHISAAAIGLVLGTAAVGTLLGSVITGPLTRRFGIGPVYTLGVILFPLPLVLVPLAGGPRPLVFAMLVVSEFISGIGLMMLDINGGVIYQAAVPERLISRFFGAFLTVNYGVRPIGSLAGGLLGETLGLRPALWIASVGALVGVLFLLPTPVPRMRDLPERRA